MAIVPNFIEKYDTSKIRFLTCSTAGNLYGEAVKGEALDPRGRG
jgi:hypothetical protein